MSLFRELVADAALILWQSGRRVSQEWFAMTQPENILERAALFASLAQVNITQYREQHGSRVIAAPGSERLASVAVRKVLDADQAPGLSGAIPGSPIRFGDYVIGYVGGEKPVADAAQWIWLNRSTRADWSGFNFSDVILKTYQIGKEFDARKQTEEKKYSLSDLRRAYDMGHHRGVSNGVHCYTNQMRDEALKEL